jgi:hypothetical protein
MAFMKFVSREAFFAAMETVNQKGHDGVISHQSRQERVPRNDGTLISTCAEGHEHPSCDEASAWLVFWK